MRFAFPVFVLAAACGPIATDDICTCPPIPTDGGPPSFDASFADAADATDGMTTARVALCEITSCDPDDATACGYHPDAGDAATASCRVEVGHTSCAAAGAGADGDTCASGADCAPGYDCVGAGICRHYCCSDDACSALGMGSDSYFCDLGTATSMMTVPVCSPVQACTPLQPSACASGDVCTLVQVGTDVVATCDGVGPGLAGDSCETKLCASGFACLGALGSRTCTEMCDSMYPCPAGHVCQVSGLCE